MVDIENPCARLREQEAREFGLIWGLSYAVLLVAALAGRLVPGAAEPRESVFAEARSAADSMMPFTIFS